MKRILISAAAFSAIVYLLSCSKTDPGQASCTTIKPAVDSTQLLAFAKTNGITPTMDTSYVFYQIITPGSGATPVPSSTVYVRYAARFMDGSYLDSSGTSTGFILSNLILGWQYCLPKIKAGGEIKLLVPSALAYGCTGNSSTIPSNAPLYFHIYLDSLK